MTLGIAPVPIERFRVAPPAGAKELDELAEVPSVAFKVTLLPKLVALPKLSEDLVPFCIDIFMVSPFVGLGRSGRVWATEAVPRARLEAKAAKK